MKMQTRAETAKRKYAIFSILIKFLGNKDPINHIVIIDTTYRTRRGVFFFTTPIIILGPLLINVRHVKILILAAGTPIRYLGKKKCVKGSIVKYKIAQSGKITIILINKAFQ